MTRLHTLDGMRGIAACFVVLYHLGLARLPLAPDAVDLFFIISGIVIERSYGARGLTVATFMIRRWQRLYPLYLLGTILGAIALLRFHGSVGLIMAHQATPQQVALMLLYGAFFIPAFVTYWLYPLDVSAWSLFYEVVANFAWACRLRDGLCWAVVVISAVVLLTHPWLALARAGFGFFLGVLMQRHKTAWAAPGAWLALLATGALLAVQAPAWRLPLALIAQPALVWWALHTRPRQGTALMGAAGDVSYGLYILHVPLMLLHVPWEAFLPVAWGATRAMEVKRWKRRMVVS